MSILRYCITDSPNDFTFSEFYILNLGISVEFGEARGLNTESLASLYAYAKKNEFTFINFEENYEKISKEDIEYIEFKTREIISLISPEIVYFSVSHSDQDSFHIHRIIKK